MITFRALIPAIGILAVGCSSPPANTTSNSPTPASPTQTEKAADIKIDASSNGKTVSAKVGQTIELEMPVLTDAGYHADAPQLSPGNVVEFREQWLKSLAPPSATPVPGAPTDAVFRFIAIAPGETDATIVSRGPSGNVDPGSTLKVHFSVGK